MIPADSKGVAEAVIYGLEENDKIETIDQLYHGGDKSVILLQVDTGERFRVEVTPE